MTTEEQIVIPVADRSAWGAGPWDDEPDYEAWTTAAGLRAIARRAPRGHWCGYVAVVPGHPWHRQGYDDVAASAHGGLTYSDLCAPEIGVCHVPEPGEPEDVWWLGFDTAHGGDLSPTDRYDTRGLPTWFVYRDLAYIRAQCESLADQAIEAVQA